MATFLRSVLVSDAVDPLCVDLLKSNGIEVVCKFKLSKNELINELQEHDGLIVRSDTKVTKDVINNVSRLRVIGRAGTGVDNIDLEAATKNGIVVLNTPGGNSISACEMTCALITNLARNVVQACQSLKEGRWDRKLYTGNELYGKTLAVLGLGRIGREVAKRMASYGMRIVGFDPMVSTEDAKAFGVEKMELEEIWPIADYITVHTPLIPQTRNLINETTLTKSKKGVCIINVARGGIIDEVALLKALQDGRCGGAALDVYEEEPPKSEVTLALIKHPLVVATPHLGASTYEAQQRVAVEIAEQFVALTGKNEKYVVTGAVNTPLLSAVMVESNKPWLTLAERLGRLLGNLLKQVPSGTVVNLTAIGKEVENMKFLNAPLLSGLLSTQVEEDLNLISAPVFAKEAGLTVNFTTKAGEPSLEVEIGSYTVLGTIGARNGPTVLSVNGSSFLPHGVGIDKNVRLFDMTGSKLDITKIILDIKQSGGELVNLAVSAGASTFVLVQTNEDVSHCISNLL